MSKEFRLVSVQDLLTQNGVTVGDSVRLQGWVRTRRDSKAGLSFIQLHDGSCFEPAQVVAPGELKNYQDAILHLTTGCSLIVEGEAVASDSHTPALDGN